MTENEEIVYNQMGLDPILLLEEIPKSENYTVHIIRPGENEVEEKRIKNNQTNILPKDKNPVKQDSNNTKERKNIKEEEQEEAKVNVDLDKESNDLISADKIAITEKNELDSTETKEADEDPRRKRRRSSASS